MEQKRTPLEKVQLFAKCGKVLSKVTFILTIVGLVACLVGLAILYGIRLSTDLQMIERMEASSDKSFGTMASTCVCGAILCLGELLLARKSLRFYQEELEIGNPFDNRVADGLRALGIATFVLPLVSTILAAVASAVFSAIYTNVDIFDHGNEASLGLAVMYIVLSVICRYGAELRKESV